MMLALLAIISMFLIPALFIVAVAMGLVFSFGDYQESVKATAIITAKICMSASLALIVFVVLVYTTTPASETILWLGQVHDPTWDWPVRVAGIGIYLICLLFIWKPFSTKKRRITALCLAFALLMAVMGIVRFINYDRSLTTFSVAREDEHNNASLARYEPFRENTLAKSLDEPSDLKLEDNLPRLDGATALYPLYSAFARAVYPEADYPTMDYMGYVKPEAIITCTTTSRAFERLIEGEADLIFLAGVSEEQREMAAERGLELIMTPIGREAFVFFVNKRNAATNLTIANIRDIYSGQTTNWRGISGENDRIRPFQRAKNSGSQTRLQEIMGDTPLMTAPENDYYDGMYQIYQAVAVYKNYQNALGYSFLYYINEMIASDEIKLLSIEGVPPTVENIANGTYPLAEDFYAIAVKREPESAEEAERLHNAEIFIEWILSPQGQSLVEKTGYVALKQGEK
jgi:phosphate transport system substrate-binding protein